MKQAAAIIKEQVLRILPEEASDEGVPGGIDSNTSNLGLGSACTQPAPG